MKLVSDFVYVYDNFPYLEAVMVGSTIISAIASITKYSIKYKIECSSNWVG